MSDVSTLSPTEKFRAFLEAADQAAEELIVTDGISPYIENDRNQYYLAVEGLAEKFAREPWEPINIDNVRSQGEFNASIDAAHMIGLAMGLRLARMAGAARG